MEKPFTLNDLQLYYREVSGLRMSNMGGDTTRQMPSKAVIQNLLNYSGALNVLKTRSAGVFLQLAN